MSTPPVSPQEQLAERIGGTILGPSSIEVGGHLVTTSPTGVVRVDRHPVGRWNDDPADLSRAVQRAIRGYSVHRVSADWLDVIANLCDREPIEVDGWRFVVTRIPGQEFADVYAAEVAS